MIALNLNFSLVYIEKFKIYENVASLDFLPLKLGDWVYNPFLSTKSDVI